MKRKSGFKRRVKGGLCMFLCWLLCFGMLSGPELRVHAEDLVQTEGPVTLSIRHEHGGEDSGCYGLVLVNPCGGKYNAMTGNMSGYYQCSKCGRIVHGIPRTYNHEGDYEEGLSCTEKNAGTFYIERVSDGSDVWLMAGLNDRNSNVIGSYDISWDHEGAQANGSTKILHLKTPGIYTATLKYKDLKSGVNKTYTLSYTDLTVPGRISFVDRGTLLEERSFKSGEPLTDVNVPLRTGYDFTGFYSGDVMYYDSEGHPAVSGAIDIKDYTLEAGWEAKSYAFSYEGDNGASMQAAMTFDAPPPEISPVLPEERAGYTFDGYSLEGIKVYDSSLRPVGVWTTELPEGSYSLEQEWIQKKYNLHYACDENGEGGSDRELVFGQELPRLSLPAERPGYSFDGYYYDGRRIYDENGDPVSELPELFEGSGISLVSIWHPKQYVIHYGPDENGDGEGDLEFSLGYGDPLPEIFPEQPEQKPGYIFTGYYIDDIKLYDENGEPAGSFDHDIPEGNFELKPVYVPETYTFRYGNDSDGDGLPDGEGELTYDEVPPILSLDIPAPREGYDFLGFFLGDVLVYDSDGVPQGVWKQPLGDEIPVLTPSFSRIFYTLDYGNGDSVVVEYNGTLPPLPLDTGKTKKGYERSGYFAGDVMLYDAAGNPVGDWPGELKERRYTLEERWTPKSYTLRYGGDNDGDGLPDRSAEVTYGEQPEPVPVPELGEGEVFDGYFCGDIMVYDENGMATGAWLEDHDALLTLRSHKYVDPEEEERLKEQERLEQEERERLEREEQERLEQEERERLEREEQERLEQEERERLEREEQERLEQEERERLEREEQERLEQEERERLEREEQERLEQEERERLEREEQERLEQEERERLEREEQERLEQEERERLERKEQERLEQEERERLEREEQERLEQEERERLEREEQERLEQEERERQERERREKDKKRGQDNSSASTGNENGSSAPSVTGDESAPTAADNGNRNGSGSENASSVSTDTVSSNTVSNNSVSDNSASENAASGSSSENLAQGNAGAGGNNGGRSGKNSRTSDRGGAGNRGIREAEADAGTGVSSYNNRRKAEGDDGTALAEAAEAESDAQAGSEESMKTDRAYVKGESPAEMAEEESPAMAATQTAKTEEAAKKSSSPVLPPAVQTVAKVGAVTAGSLGGILGLYAGIVYLMAMAEVDTVCTNGRKKRLGRLTIHSGKGHSFLLRLSRELLEQCETDKLCIKLPFIFALKNRNRTMVIASRGKKREEPIRRVISVCL